MDKNYHCETCDWDETQCHGCGKHNFNDGVNQGRLEVINWINGHGTPKYPKLTFGYNNWVIKKKEWGIE